MQASDHFKAILDDLVSEDWTSPHLVEKRGGDTDFQVARLVEIRRQIHLFENWCFYGECGFIRGIPIARYQDVSDVKACANQERTVK